MTSPESNNNTDEVIELKKLGNEAFKKKNYFIAVENYTKALQLGVRGQPAAAIYSNLANVNTKLKDYTKALDSSTLAVQMDSQWKKGHYWKGMSHLCLKQFEDASKAFQIGSTVDSEDEEFHHKLKVVEFCKENQSGLDSLEVTDWITVANSFFNNVDALSTEVLAESLTRLTMKTKLGYKLTQCILMDLQGQLLFGMVPVNVLTPRDKIISDKMLRGELVKLYVVAIVSKDELPILDITGCSTVFNDVQKTVVRILIQYSKKKAFNEHFLKYL